MFQIPNMMGGMFTAPPQMWMQPSTVPLQPSVMDVNGNASKGHEPKFLLLTKKDKGKAKASEASTDDKECYCKK